MAWTNKAKPSTTTTYLLLEDGGFLLQENGDKLILDYGAGTWGNKSKGSATWTNKSKQ